MSTALVSITPEAQELIAFAHTFLGTAQAIRITTPDEAQQAVDQTRAIKECAKAIEETRKGYTAPLDEQKKFFMDTFRPATDVLAKAEQLLKGEITRFQQEEQRKAAALEAERRKPRHIWLSPSPVQPWRWGSERTTQHDPHQQLAPPVDGSSIWRMVGGGKH